MALLRTASDSYNATPSSLTKLTNERAHSTSSARDDEGLTGTRLTSLHQTEPRCPKKRMRERGDKTRAEEERDRGEKKDRWMSDGRIPSRHSKDAQSGRGVGNGGVELGSELIVMTADDALPAMI